MTIFSILGYASDFRCLFVAKIPLTCAKLNSIPLNRARGPLNEQSVVKRTKNWQTKAAKKRTGQVYVRLNTDVAGLTFPAVLALCGRLLCMRIAAGKVEVFSLGENLSAKHLMIGHVSAVLSRFKLVESLVDIPRDHEAVQHAPVAPKCVMKPYQI